MYGESVRINKLVEDLLMLTKLDQAPKQEQEIVQLDHLLMEMHPQLNMMARERHVHFDLTAGLSIMAEPHKLKQVVLNLFHNAVQHTHPESGSITVALYAVHNKAELTVKTTAPGLNRNIYPIFLNVSTGPALPVREKKVVLALVWPLHDPLWKRMAEVLRCTASWAAEQRLPFYCLCPTYLRQLSIISMTNNPFQLLRDCERVTGFITHF